MNTNKMLSTITLTSLAISGVLVAKASQADVNLSDNFTVKGQIRARYEALDGQFRSGKSGSDQLLLFRTLLHGQYTQDNYDIGIELQDSRTYLGDSGTPLSSSYTNVSDLLQTYVSLKNLPSIFKDSNTTKLTIGRQTISIGSKRQIERVSFANVIKSYTGIYYQTTAKNKDEFHAFYSVPIERRPKTRNEIDDNEYQFDKEQWQRRMWGLHYRKAQLFNALGSNNWGELFAYGFDETDSQKTQTANRHYLTTGFRLYRPLQPMQWNYDIEAAYRTGSRHASNSRDDNQDLDVKAQMLMFRLGYTLDHPLKVNLAFQHYYTSGDKNPDDLKFDQFERMFGGRRTDLNNTSIHGPLTPANLSATGFRIELKPKSNWDARLHYSYNTLSSSTDSFGIGKYRDTTGNAGDFLGHTIDSRLRFWTEGKQWILDTGISLFFPGSYVKQMRAIENETKRTTFGYMQVSYQF